MTLDLRGFGESDDPSLPLAPGLRFEDDVLSAARYALKNGLVRPGRIVYMGHSLGAGVILRAGRLGPRPAAIVAIGAPATNVSYERGGEDWKRRFAGERFRAMGMAPDQRSLEVMGNYLLEMDVVTQVGRRDLPRTLLVYGEHEGVASYVQDRFTTAGLPCDLHVVPDAPHSYHIVDGPLGLVFFNRELLDKVIAVIEGWILSTHEDTASESGDPLTAPRHVGR